MWQNPRWVEKQPGAEFWFCDTRSRIAQRSVCILLCLKAAGCYLFACATSTKTTTGFPAQTYLKPSRSRFGVQVVRRVAVYEAMMLALSLRVQLRTTQALHKEIRLRSQNANNAHYTSADAAGGAVQHITKTKKHMISRSEAL